MGAAQPRANQLDQHQQNHEPASRRVHAVHGRLPPALDQDETHSERNNRANDVPPAPMGDEPERIVELARPSCCGVTLKKRATMISGGVSKPIASTISRPCHASGIAIM